MIRYSPCKFKGADPFPGQGGASLPVILVHELDGSGYREVRRLVPGETGTATLPYPVSLDLGTVLLRG